MTKQKTTAVEQVLKHLQKYGKIDQSQALDEFGTWRLSSIIHQLRHNYGLPITSEIKYVVTRYGALTRVAIYHLNQSK